MAWYCDECGFSNNTRYDDYCLDCGVKRGSGRQHASPALQEAPAGLSDMALSIDVYPTVSRGFEVVSQQQYGTGIYKIFTGVQYPFNLNQNPLAADHIGYTANLTTDPFNLETYHVAPTGNTCNVSNIVMDIFRNFEFLSCVDLSS